MSGVEHYPLTPRCARILAAREHALLGVSALNGYFSMSVIRETVRWAVRTFDRVDVLVPGMELAGTLVARGWPPAKAVAKARAGIGNTRNRVIRALDEAGADNAGVFDWNELESNVAYKQARTNLEELFAGDAVFRGHCLDAVRPIVGVEELPRHRAESALPFLLAELPLVLDTPSLLGTASSLFCYPRTMPMVRAVYAGMATVFPATNQGFLSVRLT
ncbi:tRNA-dependent cyclodipeptide synthase [Nonomuraea rhizosphaerae]|uniref:tRNA-dependent cyclodipeptide synthase n=1 Tax=Nonomuraea rhizosphaerae TaxID=2665663 RepID=UPI001C5E1910|nr:tRNA-dependent cyclodipeptide synthase [Nonomuraea rhizosphaerae]